MRDLDGHDPRSSGHLALAPFQAGKDARVRSRLVVDGAETEHVVRGVVLEATLRTDFGTLLLTSDDCPYEERLHAHLLDQDRRVRERVTLGRPYQAGAFRELERLEANAFTFRFFDGAERWLLTARAPRWTVHLAACSLARFYGSVARPPSEFVSRSSLTLRRMGSA